MSPSATYSPLSSFHTSERPLISSTVVLLEGPAPDVEHWSTGYAQALRNLIENPDVEIEALPTSRWCLLLEDD